MKLPEPILCFFGHLFNFKPETYADAATKVISGDKSFTQQDDIQDDSDEESDNDNDEESYTDEDTVNEDDGNTVNKSSGDISTQRCRKVQSLFQIMYYICHNGRKRTPLHIMCAEFAHSLGRGGKIFTSCLNHMGLSLSYDSLRRYQYDIAAYTTLNNKDTIPLPANFDPGEFTSGGSDNWDHEGENTHEHDLVSVLYQDKPRSARGKPKISDTAMKHGPRAFTDILPCQKLQEFHKPVRRPDVPESFTVKEDTYTSDTSSARYKDLAWSVCRLDIL